MEEGRGIRRGKEVTDNFCPTYNVTKPMLTVGGVIS